ncbi:MAG: hypothetical protein U0470_05585 [Anaerolineae bacterium]
MSTVSFSTTTPAEPSIEPSSASERKSSGIDRLDAGRKPELALPGENALSVPT